MQYINIICTMMLFFSASLAAPIFGVPQNVENSIFDAQEPNAFDFVPSSLHMDSFSMTSSRQLVRWDTDRIPRSKVIADGLVILGYLTAGSDDEHLDMDHPLASGFSLADGEVEISIPTNDDPSRHYFIILFGDSGSVAPEFTIDHL